MEDYLWSSSVFRGAAEKHPISSTMTSPTVPEHISSSAKGIGFPWSCARFLGRVVAGGWRFVRSRKMLYLLAGGGMLVCALRFYENWNGAREWETARHKVLARIGTERLLDVLPPEVAEADNFFALPLIQSWRPPAGSGATLGHEYRFPADKLYPAGFQPPAVVEINGRQRLDLPEWIIQRAASGQPDAAGKPPAQVLAADLGDGGSVTSGLIAGLDRPESQLIPCRRRAVMTAGGDPAAAQLTYAQGACRMQDALAVHLLAASLIGDAARVRDLAGVMLKLGDAFVKDPNLVPQISGLAMNKVTLTALNSVLDCLGLTDADYQIIQDWLAATNDLECTETTTFETLLSSATVFEQFKARVTRQSSFGPDFEARAFLATLIAPVGWVETNRAHAAEAMLKLCGTGGPENWRSGMAGAAEIRADQKGKWGFNPRRLLAEIAIPATGGIWQNAAENLVRRCCAILTCALHRHRLKQGAFPASLTELEPGFLPGPVVDPARAEAPLNYRLTKKGFLLWSVGVDRVDDQGNNEKDWVWRHEPG
jgi:hypothetical protein